MSHIAKTMRERISRYLYRYFEIPVLLQVTSDSGQGQPIIFLHGIASNSATWRNVIPLLRDLPVRVITIDLLGFGESPSPDWVQYTASDHAKSVARTIRRLGLKKAPIVVGHSMGGIIAAELATLYPKLVSKLVLCSIPLYAENDFTDSIAAYRSTGRHLNNIYFKLYEKLIEKKELTLSSVKRIEAMNKSDDFDLSEANWNSFTKSLQNVVVKQRTIDQLEELAIPTHIIYGKLDVLLLSKYYTALKAINSHIQVSSVAAAHTITPRYARVIAKSLSSSVLVP